MSNKKPYRLIKDFEYPYEPKKRIVVFGGHDTFLKVIKPMLPSVKYVDARMKQSFNPALVKNADIVLVQTNCISHRQFYNVVREAKKHNKKIKYFKYASAKKCADQVVAYDIIQ